MTPRAGGWAYGLLGAPLAFVALPLYVLLPNHYASQFGVPLAPLGLMLLAVRAADAFIDPWLGRQIDLGFSRPHAGLRALAWLAALVLALSFGGLFFPPWREPGALLLWGGLMLALCSLAYSGLTVLHQAWGARWGGDAAQRTRIVAWREGCALAGVLAASVLPGMAGLASSWAALSAGLVLGLALLLRQPWPQPGVAAPTAALTAALTAAPTPTLTPTPPPAAARTSPWAPLRHPGLRRLLLLYALNGVASALPTTLVLFFIRDRLQAEAAAPALLALYFAAGALSLPLWVRVVRRVGLLRAWGLGMGLALLGFVGAIGLGAGDVWAFAAICALCGLALGADLSVPSALLAGLLQHSGEQGRSEGAWFGWWQLVTKLNLALAAGLGLPLLGWLGYQAGTPDPAGLSPLGLAYALLPCVLKALALGLLWRFSLKEELPA
jgi:GPH family glycoside/pentoside/hexuronide:cation symporter